MHVESLSRSTVKRRSSGSSRVIDLTAMYRRDWNSPKAMTTPWSGKLLAKQFDRVTRDMTVQSHDDVIEQDKEKADLAFSKKQTQERKQRKFEGGVPNFLLAPKYHAGASRPRKSSWQTMDRCVRLEPTHTQLHLKSLSPSTRSCTVALHQR